jgi:hypothetical protein
VGRTSVMRALLMVASFLVLTFAPVGCGEETGATVALLRLDRLLAKASGHTHGDEHTLADELPGNIDYPVSMASSADGTGSVTTLLEGVAPDEIFPGTLRASFANPCSHTS